MSVSVGANCPICLLKGKHCVVQSFQLNFKESLVNCEDPDCSFPFGYDNSISLIIKKSCKKSVAGKENRVRPTVSLANNDSLDLDRIISQELRDDGGVQMLDTYTSQLNNDFGFLLDDCLNFIDENPIMQSNSLANKIEDLSQPTASFDSAPSSSKNVAEIDLSNSYISKPGNNHQLPVNIITNDAVSCLTTTEKLSGKVEQNDFQVVFINEESSGINVSTTSESKLNINVKTPTDNVVKIQILDSNDQVMLEVDDSSIIKPPIANDRLMKRSIYYALSSDSRQQVVEKKKNVVEAPKRPSWRSSQALHF